MLEKEFLEELENALSGSLSPALVNENIRFYEEYIETEKRKGRNEWEIMDELGDPRLIARTIIDTADESEKRGAPSLSGRQEERRTQEEEGMNEPVFKITRVSGLKVIAALAAILIVFFLVFTLALFLVGSIISAFFPAIIVAVIIWAFIRIFN